MYIMHKNEILNLLQEYRDAVNREISLRDDLKRTTDRLVEINRLLGYNLPEQFDIEAEQNKQPKTKYKTDWNNIKKAKHLIETARKCMTIRSIVDSIKDIEKKKDDIEFDRQVLGNLSSSMGTKAKDKIIFRRYKPHEGSEWFYGLVEWWGGLDIDDKPEKEYRPD